MTLDGYFAMWVIGFASGLLTAATICYFASGFRPSSVRRIYQSGDDWYAIVAIKAPEI